MQVGGPVYARNLIKGVTVMASDPRSSQFIQWEAMGDRNGGDVQPVPEDMVHSPAFSRALRNGVLALEVDESNADLVATLDKQAAAFIARQEAAQQDIRATIETTENKDLITLKCIGPSAQGQQLCGEDVPVRELTMHDAPPLCHRHINLKNEYVPTAIDRDEKGNKTVEWKRQIIDPRVQLPR